MPFKQWPVAEISSATPIFLEYKRSTGQSGIGSIKSFAITNDVQQLIAVIGEHNHEAVTPQNIDRQVLRENCKRKANESISTRSSKIIRKTLLINSSTDIAHKDNYFVRKAMYMVWWKNFPEHPKSFDEAINKI
ncbi:Hypothetical protein CINCED_3A009752 [Cinara cedri]|uniref:Uncharacterized protein n=1 Tax=Cinara cedri TaxID=506608 RepID=A0A5E4M4L2_9HEMI|nr:Hypothetical protein CINCED_3A009752 [Cinara cedri]